MSKKEIKEEKGSLVFDNNIDSKYLEENKKAVEKKKKELESSSIDEKKKKILLKFIDMKQK